MSQQDSKRIRLVELENCSLDLEYNSTYAILHLPRVDKFGVKEFNLFKRYLDDLTQFLSITSLKGPYAATSDPKVQRLITRLGFQYLGDHDNLKVYIYATSPNGDWSRLSGSGGRTTATSS